MSDRENKTQQNETSGHRLGKLTILQIMGILAVVGLLATWVLRHYFG
jgi:hypothetical protein